uniref:Uncharacterized protein n=1 Tax=Nothobranchius furzeri TaxID=105023 RepID=A0A8C6PC69_NOTFU
MASEFKSGVVIILLCSCLLCISALDAKTKPKKKDIRDYNDADMARLLEFGFFHCCPHPPETLPSWLTRWRP